jgi:hypothetical protein
MDVNPVLSVNVLDAIEDEVLRSWEKHGDHAMINPALPFVDRLAILGEEFGEVCRSLTYDNGNRGETKKELIQLAAMAASWAHCLMDEGK